MSTVSRPSGRRATLIRIGLLLGLLYVFLLSIQVMGSAFKLMGSAHAEGLFSGLVTPFAGLSVGILATVLVQSSSMTTSLVVSAVGAGQLPLEVAVFAIMGCNIGTTITNTLVSLGHVRQDAEFRRAFAGSTMHDFFNIMAVMVFMPLEMATGMLRKSAIYLAEHIYTDGTGGKFTSPIKAMTKPIAKMLKHFCTDTLDLGSTWGGIAMLVLALGALVCALVMITKIMKLLMMARMERSLNRVLEKSGLLGIVIGIALTVSVQSSSITTSLMVPLFAAGILKLENGFPVTLGANIGTTVTALLAALTTGVNGLTIALVHLLFNLSSTAIIYPVPAVRRVPIRLAEKLAELAVRNRFYAVFYVVGFFVIIPLVGNLIFR